jgi:Protein of unknown function (DUF2608)
MMTYFKVLLFLALFSLPLKSSAKIIETFHIADVVPMIDEECWFLVDLDNTLFEAKQALGHADWFYDEIQKRIKQGMNREEAIRDAYPLWIKVQSVCEVQPLENDFVSAILFLQSRGVVVMGFTHRQPYVVQSTFRQLKSIGIDFLKTAPSQETLIISANYPTIYTQGVYFVGDYNKKGDLLMPFLKEINKIPKKIVFIDDKKKNVEELENLLSKEGIEYLGIHYRAIEKAPPRFSPEVAAFQYQFLGKIISNETALFLMEKNRHQR